MTSGKRSKQRRKERTEVELAKLMLEHDLSKFDVWRDPISGEVFFAEKEEEQTIFTKEEVAALSSDKK